VQYAYDATGVVGQAGAEQTAVPQTGVAQVTVSQLDGLQTEAWQRIEAQLDVSHDWPAKFDVEQATALAAQGDVQVGAPVTSGSV
jgi:hypothetical protein